MSQFKRTKFRVTTLTEARAAEKAMFTLGFAWRSKQTGEQRMPYLSLNSDGWLFVDEDCRMTQGPASLASWSHRMDYKTGSVLVLLAAAAEFKVTKTEARRKHRKSQAMKRAGWLPNTGVRVEGAEQVLFRDGTSPRAGAGSWAIPYAPDHDKTVEWYKMPAAKATVTQAEMVAGIVKDAGGKEVDAEGFTVWTGGSCPVPEGTLVDVKYRDGETYSRIPANELHTTPRDASGPFWSNDACDNDIVAYRVSPVIGGDLTSAGFVISTGQMTLQSVTLTAPKLPDRSNPKDAMGDKKVPLALCSPIAKAQWAVCQYVGLVKYGAWNWRIAGVRSSVYLSAMQRHMDAYNSGEEFDPIDGTPHLGHIMACAAILIDAKAAGKLNDDRPPSVDIRGAYADVEAQMAKAVSNYGHMLPRHYTIKDTQSA